MTTHASTHSSTHPPTSARHRWASVASYSAVFWALAYAVVALIWTWRGSGFPAGTADPNGDISLLAGLDPAVGAPLFAAAALAGAAVGLGMARTSAGIGRWWRRLALGYAIALTAAMLLVVPDIRLLQLAGYLPTVAVRAPFDTDIRAAFVAALTPQLLHQVVIVLGGLCWVVATVAFARRSAGRCERCGRGAVPGRWTTLEAAARWGRVATYVAAAVPAFYGITRWAWALRIPLGMSQEFVDTGVEDGMRVAEIGLGSFALVGAVLTLGLVQRWGERFPRWMLGLAGRRVPIGLAVVPAAIVSELAFTGGVGIYLLTRTESEIPFSADAWGAVGPGLLFPVWGVALALATLAYYLRRRGACPSCGRGPQPVDAA